MKLGLQWRKPKRRDNSKVKASSGSGNRACIYSWQEKYSNKVRKNLKMVKKKKERKKGTPKGKEGKGSVCVRERGGQTTPKTSSNSRLLSIGKTKL